MAPKEVMGSEEVAELLGVDKVTVQRRARAGKLPCVRIGRRWVFYRHVLEEWLEARMRENVKGDDDA
jgi:excisionase family DNA binding protein